MDPLERHPHPRGRPLRAGEQDDPEFVGLHDVGHVAGQDVSYHHRELN
ncbi:MAG: hypothetical protein ACRD0H_00945 [Actinomycetes bacterium]